MEIRLIHLLAAMERLVDGYLERGIESISVEDMDEYWLVSAPDWADFSKDPELSVGSLSDDLSGLEKLVAGDMPTAVDFDRLATALRVVSSRLTSE